VDKKRKNVFYIYGLSKGVCINRTDPQNWAALWHRTVAVRKCI